MEKLRVFSGTNNLFSRARNTLTTKWHFLFLITLYCPLAYLSSLQILPQLQQLLKPGGTLASQSSRHLHSKNVHKQLFKSFSLVNSFSSCNNSSPAPSRRRCSFISNVSVEDSSIDTNEEVDDLQRGGESNRKPQPSLKAILQIYRDAILDDDDKTLSEIDAIIYEIEKERNGFAEKMSALSAEVASGKEKLIRLQADFDNFRKRSEKERLTIRTNAQGEVIESLLPMVDNFERAKQQLKPETDIEKKIDTSYQGIYKQFVEIMRTLRVAVVETVGKPFDPSLHEAIAREESGEYKEGIVTQEFRRGFLLGGRLLRPAMVKVSTGPGKKKVPIAVETSTGKTTNAAELDER